jgi:hypothetical protein
MNNTEQKLKRLTFEAWAKRFRPIMNHLDKSASFDGLMFETYDTELAHVLMTANGHLGKTGPRKVWTWVDGDNGGVIVEGYHLCNRLGYFITERPAKSGEAYEITLD